MLGHLVPTCERTERWGPCALFHQQNKGKYFPLSIHSSCCQIPRVELAEMGPALDLALRNPTNPDILSLNVAAWRQIPRVEMAQMGPALNLVLRNPKTLTFSVDGGRSRAWSWRRWAPRWTWRCGGTARPRPTWRRRR